MKSYIAAVIKEQREELEKIELNEKIIERERLKETRAYLSHPNILVITGIRRCGKSIFSYLLEKGNKFAYINFDDERLIGLKAEELNNVLEAAYQLYGNIEYIVLDEIQNIPNWELFVNRLRRVNKVILTGSNSNLLSGELATHLTGRYLDIKIFPFSFKEFLLFKGFKISKVYTTQEKSAIINYLNEYMILGGLPESYKFGKSITAKIYEDILTKDLLLKFKIKKINEFKNMSRYLISNSSEEITYSSLSRSLNIKHVSTVSNWVSYLENSFLIFKLERFSFKLKQQFIAPKKIYCYDTGIVNAVGFKFSENKGKMVENIVAIEMQRRKEKNKSLEVYYWKDITQNEVDFVLKENTKIVQLTQVSCISDVQDLKNRTTKSLLKSSKELRCNNLLVITWDYEVETKIGGKKVTFIPLWKWLLEG